MENSQVLSKIIKLVFNNPKHYLVTDHIKSVVNDIYFVKFADFAHEVVVKYHNRDVQLTMKGNLGSFEKEKKIYNILKLHTNIPTPKIYATGILYQNQQYEYIVMEKLNGTQLYNIDHNITQIEKIYYCLGEAVSSIHNLSYPTFGAIENNRITNQYSKWQEFFSVKLENLIYRNYLRKVVLPREFTKKCETYCRDRLDLLNDYIKPALVHSDLSAGNILVNEDNEKKFSIGGIMDWEFAFSGDKDLDLTYADIYLFSYGFDNYAKGAKVREAFFQGYKKNNMISDTFNLKEDLYYIFLSLQQIIFYLRAEDINNARMFVNSINNKLAG
jgi:aminoglycoside phosphotransferase (APT) family kinase protein